ncbi:MAG: TonB-dependent receptor, partial [Pseudomonadota bacterium]
MGIRQSGKSDSQIRLVAAAMLASVPLVVGSQSGPVVAQTRAEVDIPAGRLSSAIRTLSRQTRVSIASSDQGIRAIRSRSVRGNFTAAQALERLLAGTPFRSVRLQGGGYRVERKPAPRRVAARPARPVAVPTAPPPAPPPPPQPIIVEATKRSAASIDYAGGIKVLDLATPGLLPEAARLDDLLASVPSVSGTALGPGRNKIFLRGIADSSFNGPTQATIGLYLGEQRVIFSAPNPDLRLVDMETVELLEGPQGSLYGAGTLAGLLRVNPRAPNASAIESQAWVSGAITSGADESWDAGSVLNLPLSDNSAFRVVGYAGQERGFIDDTGRNLENINGAEFFGGRAAFAVDLGPDWDVTLSGFGQQIDLDDGQYIDAQQPGLSRSDRVAQPFEGRIYGGAITARGYVGDVEIASATGFVDNALSTTFDSSVLVDRPRAQQAFRERRDIRLITHETRASGGDLEGFNWLLGFGALRNRDEVTQLFDNVSNEAEDPPPFARQRFKLDEIALFGEGSYPITADLSVTTGARVLYTWSAGERSFRQDTVVEPRNGPTRLLPAFALSWKPFPRMIAYFRAQQGFRTGGVTIEREENGDPDTARFDPDKIRSFELGVRGSTKGNTRVNYSAVLHRSDWDDIQADIIEAQGFPITRNIGDGMVTGVDASIGFETISGWRLDLA